jgi:hypothetical protein
MNLNAKKCFGSFLRAGASSVPVSTNRRMWATVARAGNSAALKRKDEALMPGGLFVDL